jgi:hypothetical protein
MIKYDWHPLRYVPHDTFLTLNTKLHLAAQNVALVGIHYSKQADEQPDNTLSWIPGLWRMAGRWVEGTKHFVHPFPLPHLNSSWWTKSSIHWASFR